MLTWVTFSAIIIILTSGQTTLTEGHIAATTNGSVVFARWCQCALRKSPYTESQTMVAMATSLSTSAFPSNTWFLGPIQAHKPNGISISSAVFAQLTAECPYTLVWDALFPQNCPFPWGIWTPSNTWFPAPTQVLNPNGIVIGSAVFVGLTSVTDRQTEDHATRSVTTGRIYVRSTGDAA